jgi:hypothetical protein
VKCAFAHNVLTFLLLSRGAPPCLAQEKVDDPTMGVSKWRFRQPAGRLIQSPPPASGLWGSREPRDPHGFAFRVSRRLP